MDRECFYLPRHSRLPRHLLLPSQPDAKTACPATAKQFLEPTIPPSFIKPTWFNLRGSGYPLATSSLLCVSAGYSPVKSPSMAMLDNPAMALARLPFSPGFPAEILNHIMQAYYKNEVLVISNPRRTPDVSDAVHPLVEYREYFVREGRSVLNMTSTSQRLRSLCLKMLAENVCFDIRTRVEGSRFIQTFSKAFRADIGYISIRAIYADFWYVPMHFSIDSN